MDFLNQFSIIPPDTAIQLYVSGSTMAESTVRELLNMPKYFICI
ncbi:hypothetical protein BDE27_3545 [Xenorhabdus ehlersii]|uniref:Uncharacterized protein n=1 Tax=Xenorhabdus ehlersii TaxID=290111 RepID=A0A2D0ISZ4_9GAMM|nr:hypothetical protein [Xenorhabdus sp. TS4]PHM24388.1 hypothetical protein Xehl_02058 [Xenorhabdus ehlersii]PHM24918.1 hypothetical protein Xehl_01693 [Xenorhabdus ehlersii]RKE87989.1 hypothetical protein BDE27_3545 [Xenorhabdus ehlersii]